MSTAEATPEPVEEVKVEDVKLEAEEKATEETAVAAPLSVLDENGHHKFAYKWAFYVDRKLLKAAKYKDYQDNLLKIGTFNTLEGFWGHYRWMKSPEDVEQGHNLFMFKDHFVPAWETFPRGGTWIIKVRKKNGVIFRLWEELLFAVVGELFECDDVAGVMLSSRTREHLLSIWNMDNVKNPEAQYQIGEKLREILNLDESTQVEYKYFKASIKDGSTYRNARKYAYAASGPADQQY